MALIQFKIFINGENFLLFALFRSIGFRRKIDTNDDEGKRQAKGRECLKSPNYKLLEEFFGERLMKLFVIDTYTQKKEMS